MQIKIIVHTLLLCSFSFLQSMELIVDKETPTFNNTFVSDENLQKLIGGLNTNSLNIVNFIKSPTKINERLTPQSLKALLCITQHQLNRLFLDNVEDDNFRPFLLSMGAQINTQTKDKRNCLWFTKKPNLLAELIDQGVKVDEPDKHGATRLYNLLYRLNGSDAHENIAAARVLLEHKANPNIITNEGWLLSRVIQHSKPNVTLEATELLLEYYANPNIEDPLDPPLIRAIKTEICKLVELLLFKGANPNTPNKLEEYPLHIAMQQLRSKNHGYYNQPTINSDIVILLLNHNANPNVAYQIKPYNMPLHVAVLCRQPDIITALIDHGAEKYHCDDDGYTAYDLAQQEPDYEQIPKRIVNLLKPDATQVRKSSGTGYAPIKDATKQQLAQSQQNEKSVIEKTPDNCILQ